MRQTAAERQDEDACVSPLTCFHLLFSIRGNHRLKTEDRHNPTISCHEKQAVSLSFVTKDPQQWKQKIRPFPWIKEAEGVLEKLGLVSLPHDHRCMCAAHLTCRRHLSKPWNTKNIRTKCVCVCVCQKTMLLLCECHIPLHSSFHKLNQRDKLHNGCLILILIHCYTNRTRTCLLHRAG